MSFFRKFFLFSLISIGSFSLLYQLIQFYFKYQKRRSSPRLRNKSQESSQKNQNNNTNPPRDNSATQASSSTTAASAPPHGRTAEILVHSSLWDAFQGTAASDALQVYIDHLKNSFPYLSTKNTPLQIFDNLRNIHFDKRGKYLIIGPEKALNLKENQSFLQAGDSDPIDVSIVAIMESDLDLDQKAKVAQRIKQRILPNSPRCDKNTDLLLTHEDHFDHLLNTLNSNLVQEVRFTSLDVQQQMNLRFGGKVCLAVAGDASTLSSTQWLEPKFQNFWL